MTFDTEKPVLISKYGKEYQDTEYNGAPARIFYDGAIRDEGGLFLARHPEGHVITSEDASALRARGVDKNQRLLGEGLANAAMKAGKGNGAPLGKGDAVRYMGERLGAILFESKRDGDSINAARAIGEMSPMKHEKGSQQQAAQPAPVQQTVIAVLLQRITADDVLDAEILDAAAESVGQQRDDPASGGGGEDSGEKSGGAG